MRCCWRDWACSASPRGGRKRCAARGGFAIFRSFTFAILAAAASPALHAAFTPFTGGLSAQSDRQSAVGSFVFEGFQSYAQNTSITALPAFGLTFDLTIGGTPPGIYEHSVANTPSGPREIANFPGNCCISDVYKFGDLIARVQDGANLYAFGFWNGDPQGDALLRVYDRSNVLLGTVTASVNTGSSSSFTNSFAGFISTLPVGRLEWEGNTGDGWNHYDDFQAQVTFTNAVPEPEAYALLMAGLGLLGFIARQRKRGHREEQRSA